MPTFTLAQLEARVWDNLDGITSLYPEGQVRIVINEGLRRLNLLVGWNQATVIVPGFTVANQLVYSVPSPLIFPMKVWVEQREMSQISLELISNKYRTWVTDTNQYSGPIARWVPIGISRFALHPQDYSGGRFLEVTGVSSVTPLVGQGETVNLDNQFVDALIDYVRSRIRIKEGGLTFSQDSLAYQQMVSKVKPWIIWQGMKFPRYFVAKQTEPMQGRGT